MRLFIKNRFKEAVLIEFDDPLLTIKFNETCGDSILIRSLLVTFLF